ncbi:Piso0_005469 [Millerozyma farinosa CBS 7064]|uniref:Piso0_005469 protein n=1 Tax=Pichia sorbitophila (strain ATCC MYA-4447 / BCRC 22081 / CBS 7064 / NBRC 10061 / NRRL Y-12695) TaxID=559304 RepID=G8Y565_PICSO|nr:Piso0_005469 [Millerozyma farinosa CBS 7064]
MNTTNLDAPAMLFENLSWVDRMALRITYEVYKPSNIIYKYIGSDVLGCACLISIAITCVYIGSFASLGKPRTALDSNTDKSELWHPTDNDNCLYYKSQEAELENLNGSNINLASAIMIPLCGSAVISGLYYVVKNYDKSTLERISNIYVLFMGFFAITSVSAYVLSVFVRKVQYYFNISPESSWFTRFRLTLSEDVDGLPSGIISSVDEKKYKSLLQHLYKQGVKFWSPTHINKRNQVINIIFDDGYYFVLPITASLLYGFYKLNPVLNPEYTFPETNWIIGNFMGAYMSIFSISKCYFSNFKVASFLLMGLFVYDIYFVFKTEVMLTVATSINVPLKVSVPQIPDVYKQADMLSSDLYSSPGFVAEFLQNSKNWKLANNILGLGDIIVPGFFIAICLRYDLHRFYARNELAFHHLRSFPKPYFIVGMLSYLLGLILTVFVLLRFKHGQPALLYIVPCLLIGTFTAALVKGDVKGLLSFSEDIESPPSDTAKSHDKSASNDASESDVEDADYIVGEDSEWAEMAEEHWDIDDSAESTDSDELDLLIADQSNPVRVPIVYEFDTDEDDDTFVISSDESSSQSDSASLSDSASSDSENEA